MYSGSGLRGILLRIILRRFSCPATGDRLVGEEDGSHRKELSAGFRWTTNNRMELTALVKALLALKEPCRLEITSDSKYLLDG